MKKDKDEVGRLKVKAGHPCLLFILHPSAFILSSAYAAWLTGPPDRYV